MDQTLWEWIRVLRPGGILRIIVPDLDVVIASLASGSDPKGRRSETVDGTCAVLAQIFGVGYDSANTAEAWRHRFLFSRRTLVELLTRIPGLKDIDCYPAEEDPAYSAKILDDSQNSFSLRVQARKVDV